LFVASAGLVALCAWALFAGVIATGVIPTDGCVLVSACAALFGATLLFVARVGDVAEWAWVALAGVTLAEADSAVLTPSIFPVVPGLLARLPAVNQM
jgi:hypothetical protein